MITAKNVLLMEIIVKNVLQGIIIVVIMNALNVLTQEKTVIVIMITLVQNVLMDTYMTIQQVLVKKNAKLKIAINVPIKYASNVLLDILTILMIMDRLQNVYFNLKIYASI